MFKIFIGFTKEKLPRIFTHDQVNSYLLQIHLTWRIFILPTMVSRVDHIYIYIYIYIYNELKSRITIKQSGKPPPQLSWLNYILHLSPWTLIKYSNYYNFKTIGYILLQLRFQDFKGINKEKIVSCKKGWCNAPVIW